MKHKHIISILFLLGMLLCTVFSTYAQSKRVQAKRGEGVTHLLQRYNFPPQLYEAEFRKLNKGKFTLNGGLKIGVTYLLPPRHTQQVEKQASTTDQDKTKEKKKKPAKNGEPKKQEKTSKGYQPLFGKNYARYEISSQELKNAVFYLVSGHGGPDPGAIGLYNGHRLHEDEYAYDIILRLGRELLSRGAKVYFIIQDPKDGIRDDAVLKNSKEETCMGKAIPLDQTKRLNQRCVAINRLCNQDKAPYKRAIFIHVDSRGKGKQTDVFFYHSQGSNLGKRLAKNIQRTFDHKYGKHQPNRGFNGTVSARNLYVLHNTISAAVFLELGNIQNKRDQQRLVLNNNRQALARWIAEGIVTDYKRNKK